MPPKISCIVPVYNEAARVLSVLDVLVGHELIDEVIVINDGSTDGSEAILKKIKGIKLITYKKNKGKTHALRLGIEASKNQWIMTIDSDLVGLKKEDINALIQPIENNVADMTITLRKNSLMIFKLLGLDFVSGERIFKKELIDNIDDLEKLPKFGFEVFLNRIIIRRQLKISVVNWKNVITPRKSVKFGFFAGVKGDSKMAFEIFSVIGLIGIFRQFKGMSSLIQTKYEQGS